MNFSWLLPETVSTFGPALDDLYYVILWITGIVFFATEITLVVFMVKYRHREGRKAEYIHGSNKAEVIWTVIPFVIVMGLAFYSKALWDEIRDPDRIPPDSFPINVMASQFESLVHPFVIMFTVPLALIGVIVALYLAQVPLSVVLRNIDPVLSLQSMTFYLQEAAQE